MGSAPLAIGAGASLLGGLFGGQSRADRQRQQQAWNNLQSIFGSAMGSADILKSLGLGTQKQGIGDITGAQNYWQRILGGSRPELEAAVMPEKQRMLEAGQAEKQQAAAMGTGRTGGTAAINRNIDENVRQQIDTLIGTIRPQAVDKLTSIGQDLAQIGGQDIGAMLSALGIGESAAGTVGAQAGGALESDIGRERETATNLGNLLMSALTGGGTPNPESAWTPDISGIVEGIPTGETGSSDFNLPFIESLWG